MPSLADWLWALKRWQTLASVFVSAAILLQFSPPDFEHEWRRMSVWWVLLPAGIWTVTASHRRKTRVLLEGAKSRVDRLIQGLSMGETTNWQAALFFYELLGIAKARYAKGHVQALIGMYQRCLDMSFVTAWEERSLLTHCREWIRERV